MKPRRRASESASTACGSGSRRKAREGACRQATGGTSRCPVPGRGIEEYDQKDCQTVFANPAWKNVKMGDVTAAWYQREIDVPADWAGRRITLSADCLNSYAAVYLDGKKAGELRFPGGELDLTAQCRPGATQTLSMLVIALPLHAVMFSHSDTFGSKQVQGHVDRRGLCGDVWLAGMPTGPRISDVKVDTSVRQMGGHLRCGSRCAGPGCAVHAEGGRFR